ncbi:MAG: hypothetical protein FD145_1409 [Candidatus Saganbacteria bacterium]|uniref:Uncharacterized protein n=1 Tax=Candidatus Saganbacteria bacterium TaxID=2575572 RepID=A0A833KZX1_UNCSA|nr:MAG: hypothetical protein FD145_1409 [Candidatus Saganbacteria bacterium]
MLIFPMLMQVHWSLSGPSSQPQDNNTNQAQRNALSRQFYLKAKEIEKRIAELKAAKKPIPPDLLRDLAKAHAQWNPSRALKTWEIIINNPNYANYTGRLEIWGQYIITGYRLLPEAKWNKSICDFLRFVGTKKRLTPQEKQIADRVKKLNEEKKQFTLQLIRRLEKKL